MGTVTLPVTARTTANANNFADVKDNDQAIIDQVNGNLSAANLASNAVTTAKITDANVTDAKLANPNNSAYKTLMRCGGYASALTVNGGVPWSFHTNGTMPASGGSIGAASTSAPWLFDFASADYLVGSLTTQFRVKMQAYVGTTSPSTLTLQAGLYPVTSAANVWTFGTVATGSTTGAPTPALATSTVSRYTSGDFAASALLSNPGTYGLGLVVGSITVPTSIAVVVELQTRNT